MKIKRGCYRIVILIGKYAIKIPHTFLGLMNNRDEVTFYSKYNPHLYYSLGGFLVIRERCMEAPFYGNNEREAGEKLYKRWGGKGGKGGRPEKKRSSFGLAKVGRDCGELVAVDFAPMYVCKKCKNSF